MQIVWFKRDLRTEDHAALALAAKQGPVLPLYILEPDWWEEPDMSARHWDFVAECLHELRDGLGKLGQPLVLRMGKAVSVLEELRQTHDIKALWSHQETGGIWTFERDKAVAAWAKTHNIVWHEPQQCGVTRRLASRNGWAHRWDQFMAQPIHKAPNLTPIPNLDIGAIPRCLDIAPDRCPQRQKGGRGAALSTLESFLDHRAAPYRRAMSSPSKGALHCSRLSPYLAWGAVSMREVSQQTQLRRDTAMGPWRGALKAFDARLHWRGHFMQKLEDQPDYEHQNLHSAYDNLRPQTPDADGLAAWQKGETGLPFVDACMRMLDQTGWMNFRMRSMLMAVASYHLWLDWREPGQHLARLFTDYEPGIHWPQVQMQSGTTGINTVRIYNPIKQSMDQDPEGAFIRTWLPELATVPQQYIHEPWLWEGADTLLGKAYPFPIVDHLEAAKSARQKVWAVRKGDAFKEQKTAILTRHASRKGSRPKRAKPTDPRQLSLPL